MTRGCEIDCGEISQIRGLNIYLIFVKQSLNNVQKREDEVTFYEEQLYDDSHRVQ